MGFDFSSFLALITRPKACLLNLWQAIDNSRSNLGIDALDSVQFYWHDYNIPGYIEASLHLADLKSSGAIKAIGVTNFDVVRLSEMVDAGVPIVSNQVQYSLLDTRPENGMVDYCRSQNILLLPYGTVAGGFLSNKFLDVNPREVQINTYSLSKYASVINQRGGWDWFQVLLHTLDEIGKKHGVGIAEVASKWVLDRPAVGGIIVGARNASHVNQHRSLFSFNLDADDDAAIEEVLGQGIRPSSDVYTWERGGGWA